MLGIILWVLIVGAFLAVYFGGRLKKRNYEGVDMTVTKDWYETSLLKYSDDPSLKAWYFKYDGSFLTSGHLLVDHDENVVYEAKVLYGDAINGYELDMINHLIDYKHHHTISATVTTGLNHDDAGYALSSYFDFDKKNIWDYLESLGYNYHFIRTGLAYKIEVVKGEEHVGTVYSSNNGKNYFNSDGKIVEKAGSKGLYVIECKEKELDILFLYAMAFTRTELSYDNLE